MVTIASVLLLAQAASMEVVSKNFLQREAESSKVDVYYVTRMMDRFDGFSKRHQQAVNAFHDQELQRLQNAIRDSGSAQDKELLERAAMFSEESRLEASNSFNEMQNFVNTLKQAMGAVGSASSCALLSCGDHAFCEEDAKQGAVCHCEDGYQGNGFVCNQAEAFHPHMLIEFRPDAPYPQVADVHVATFDGQRIAVVYRDLARFHTGYLMMGHVSKERVAWAPRALIATNETNVFAPVVCQLQDGLENGLAIAFRDGDRGGTGHVVTGQFDPKSGTVNFLSQPKPFAKHQAQAAQILALPGAHIAVVFSEHVLSGSGGRLVGGAMYGAAMLFKVGDGFLPGPAMGEVTLLGKQRFASGPVARISVAQLMPSAFVVAYRLGDAGPGMKKAEASVALGQLRGNELVFSAKTQTLEPEATQIWARNVAALGSDRFAYTYHSGTEQVTKQAILQIDPSTKSMSMVGDPVVIGKGFSPYAGAVSTLLATRRSDAALDIESEDIRRSFDMPTRALSFFSKEGSSKAKARVCSLANQGTLEGCREMDWIDQDIVSLTGTPVGDGRLFFVYTNDKGTPYYELVGLEDP